jgi:hypothetical protein
MRNLIPNAFTTTRANDNRAIDMKWQRPIIFVEVPGTTPYDLYLYWHRRSMRDPNYAGFLDLLLNPRGIQDHGWTGQLPEPSTVVTYEQPYFVEGDVSIKTQTETVEDAFDKRIDFANTLFTNARSAYIRYYTEPVHPDLEEKQNAIEEQFLRNARIVFVEKTFDPVFQLIRMARQAIPDDADYEITKDQIDWYVKSVKKYKALKERWKKKSAILGVEWYIKGKMELTWPDRVSVQLNVPVDQWCRSLTFPLRPYKSPTNFKEVDEYIKEMLKN